MSHECHSSSTSSSLSPSSIITSQDSIGQVQLANNNSESSSIHHASQESNLSGPPSQTSKYLSVLQIYNNKIHVHVPTVCYTCTCSCVS